MKNLVKKHHVATSLHNLNAFLHEMSEDMGALDARLTSLQAREPATAMATVRNLEEEVKALSSRIDEIEIEGMGTVTVHETGSDILYPSEQCGVNIPWVEFGNDIVSKPEWGKSSFANAHSKVETLFKLFSDAKHEGFDTIRFWLFPSLWHNNGVYTPEMVDEAAESVELLCDVAREAGVLLVPTILSFDNYSIEKESHGGSQPFSNRTHHLLLDRVAGVFSNNQDVLDYIDLINEPEWSTTGILSADPNPKMATVDARVMRSVIKQTQDIFMSHGLTKLGYGAASLKWSNSQLLNNVAVKDFHSYEGWSTQFFPPTGVMPGSGFYMGETDTPYSQWGEFFAENRYEKVFLWLELGDYIDENTGEVVIQDALREFKRS